MDGGSEPGLAAGEGPGVATTGSAISVVVREGCASSMMTAKKIDSGSGGVHVRTSVRETVASPAQRCVIVWFDTCPRGGGVKTPTTPVK